MAASASTVAAGERNVWSATAQHGDALAAAAVGLFTFATAPAAGAAALAAAAGAPTSVTCSVAAAAADAAPGRGDGWCNCARRWRRSYVSYQPAQTEQLRMTLER